MKVKYWPVMAVLIAAASVPSFAGPFGLERGMSRDQILAIVGKDAVIKDVPDSIGGELLKLKTVPKPYRKFEAYNLFISKTEGLLKIRAVSEDIESSADGSEVRSNFDDLRKALVEGYGTPIRDFDFVKGEMWKDRDDFMMGLLKKERVLGTYWSTRDGSHLRDGICLISLDTFGLNTSKAYLLLSYEFDGWEAYVDKVNAKENSVF